MAPHSTLSGQEAAVRLAIASCSTRMPTAPIRDAEGQKALFTTDTSLRRLHGRAGPPTELRDLVYRRAMSSSNRARLDPWARLWRADVDRPDCDLNR